MPRVPVDMRSRILLVAVLTALAGSVPARAHTPFLGEPIEALALPGEANITSAASNSRGGAAVVMFEHLIGRNARPLAIRRLDGTWVVSEVAALGAQAVIPVALEDGRFAVLWDDGSTVRAQTFAADGAPGDVTTILTGVTTVISGDSDHAGWVVRSNLAGTVVVAAGSDADSGGGVAEVAVRDPGGAFAQQSIGGAEPGAGRPREVDVGPIDAAGGVTVGWSAGSVAGTAGHATRAAAGVPFGAAAPGDAGLAPSGLWPAFSMGRTLVTGQSEVIELDAATAKRCPCLDVNRIRDSRGRVAATLALLGTWRERAWYALRRHRDGTWGRPRRVSEKTGGVPIALGAKSAVGFVRATSDTDYGLFRFRSRLFVVPWGLTNDVRAPTVRLGPMLTVHRRSLLVPVWCDESCRIESVAGADGRARLSVRDSASRPRSRDLEPNDVAWLRLPRAPGAGSVSVAVGVRDLAGRRGRVAARFRPGAQPRYWWCRVGAGEASSGCRR